MGQNAYQTAVETLARRRSHAEAQAAGRSCTKACRSCAGSMPARQRFAGR